MKKFLILFIGLGVIFWGVKLYLIHGKSSKKEALERVELVLEGITQLRSGTKGDEYIALCMWGSGSLEIPPDSTPDELSNQFDKWRMEGNIFPYIKEYTIDETEKLDNAVIVSGTINGSPYKMRVIPKVRISWEQAPTF